jgi:hypothetical protein
MTFQIEEDLTIAEVARAIPLSIPGVHWNINHGHLKAIYKYRQYHISAADLATFVQARARKKKPPVMSRAPEV